MSTPVDPLFVALPLLERARGALREGSVGLFCDLEQVLQGVQPQSVAQQLTSLLAPQQLAWVCDCKLAGGQQYYRLNDEKAGRQGHAYLSASGVLGMHFLA